MRAFGARGYVSADQLKRSEAVIRQMRRQQRQKERALISALSDQDIIKIMARVLRTRAAAAGQVARLDFHQAGVPDHRIDKNIAAAFRLARQLEPKLDAMGATP